MNSKERVLKTINHEEPDRVPIDIGGMRSTGIHSLAYRELRKYLGFDYDSVKLYDVFQQLGFIEHDILDYFDADVVPVNRLAPAFGIKIDEWEEGELVDGSRALVPADFDPVKEEEVEKARQKIEMIKKKLDKGENFIKLARNYSEDRRSARNGGILPWFQVGGRMIPAYENAAFKLENEGDISDIIKTSYGYHIIRLVEKDPVGNYDEEKAVIKKRLRGQDRTQKATDAKVKQLNKKYKTKEYIDPGYYIYPNHWFEKFHQFPDQPSCIGCTNGNFITGCIVVPGFTYWSSMAF